MSFVQSPMTMNRNFRLAKLGQNLIASLIGTFQERAVSLIKFQTFFSKTWVHLSLGQVILKPGERSWSVFNTNLTSILLSRKFRTSVYFICIKSFLIDLPALVASSKPTGDRPQSYQPVNKFKWFHSDSPWRTKTIVCFFIKFLNEGSKEIPEPSDRGPHKYFVMTWPKAKIKPSPIRMFQFCCRSASNPDSGFLKLKKLYFGVDQFGIYWNK